MSALKDTEPRQGPLLQLPIEILLQIIEDESLEYEDICTLGLVSANLYEASRKLFFQGEGFRVFRTALEEGCVEVMQRCADYDAAPTNVRWYFRGHDMRSYRLATKHLQGATKPFRTVSCRPVDVLLMGYRNRCFSADQCIEALKWLIDNGYQIHQIQEWSVTVWGKKPDNLPELAPYIPFCLFNTLSTATDREYHRGICSIIHFLYDEGFVLPPAPGLGVPEWGRTNRSDGVYVRLSGDCDGLVGLMMQTAYPLSILELYLKQLDNQGLHLKSRLDNPAIPAWCQENPCTTMSIGSFIAILFDDLFDPWTWKPENPLDVAHILDDKVNLLARYQGIDDDERYVLKDIVAALRDIAAKQKEQGGLDFERDGVWCWYELCMSVSIAEIHETLPEIPPDDNAAHKDGEDKEMPKGDLIEVKRRKGQEVDEPNCEDMSKAEWWDMPLHTWYGVRYTGRSLMKGHREAWYRVLTKQGAWIPPSLMDEFQKS
ncbi:hypothetical protein NW762_007083 [Fusarium torreyae]|uniref:Uncharacterized protein n=1 Tax=Fusarium torreyae TaxID=1237075 RepID=A0A9W8S2B7_9HYPO|nr:hypothetical protein NW762_007083 [Fusarium torreyae]